MAASPGNSDLLRNTSTSSPASLKESPFLIGLPEVNHLATLPPEIRKTIYELTVRYDDLIDLISLLDPSHCSKECHSSTECVYPSLTRGSDTISFEALENFFSINEFVAEVQWGGTGFLGKRAGEVERLPRGIRGLQRAFNRIGRRSCRAIKSPELSWSSRHFDEAHLGAMSVWVSMWPKRDNNMFCVPKKAAMRHTFARRNTLESFEVFGDDNDVVRPYPRQTT